jgi:hypothetical protein
MIYFLLHKTYLKSTVMLSSVQPRSPFCYCHFNETLDYACGHIPEEQGDEPAPEHPDEPHAGKPVEGFPIEIPPIADISFSVDFAPHDGQGI